jgi:hypothetical protein
MLRLILRLLVLGVLVVVVLLLFLPDFLARTGNSLLNGVNSSNATGAAQLVPNAQGNGGDLVIDLQGLASQIPYVITLDEGQCGGKVLKTFSAHSANSSGSLSGDFTLSDFQAAVQQSIWVDVHQGNSASGPTVACGQVDINSLLAQVTPTATVPPVVVPTSAPASPKNQQISNNGNIGFPQTGVAPNGSYDNYKYPRKY